MRGRALLLTAALLAAPLSADARVLVVKQRNQSSTNISGQIMNNERVLAMLNTLGVEYDVAMTDGLRTLWVQQGIMHRPSGGSTQYDAVIHLGWRTNVNEPATGFYPDSTTILAKWPLVPTLFIVMPGISGTEYAKDMDINAGGGHRYVCSTGVSGNSAFSSTDFANTEWVVGTDMRWKAASNPTYFIRNASAPAGGIVATTRALLGISKSKQHADYIAPATARLNPTDLDSMTSFQNQGVADTMTVWERQRLPASLQVAGLTAENAPLIFCVFAGSTGSGPYIRVAHALARLDSASGGNVFTLNKKTPVKFALQVTRWGGYSKIGYRTSSGDGTGVDFGIQCVSDSCDTSFVKATLDSLQRLRVPMSFGVQTDSMATYATQMEWLRLRYPLAKVYPYNVGGTSTTAAADRVGNASASASVDTWGATRLRRLVPSGFPTSWDNGAGTISQADHDSMVTACASDTASVYCNLIRAYAKLRRYFGENRLDYTPSAPLEDYTPTYFGKAAGSMDSLVWVMHLAGLKGIRTASQNVANSIGAAAGSPRGAFQNLTVRDVRWPGTTKVVGRIAFIPSRDYEQISARVGHTAHDVAQEFTRGVLDGDWYMADRGPIYTNEHQFMSRTLIFEMPAAALGGHGAANPARWGWWYAKWLMNQCRGINLRAGRTIISPAYGDDVSEYVKRSGVR